MLCDKVSGLGVFSWTAEQPNSGAATKVDSDTVTTGKALGRDSE
jgi:hypothetical protein